MFRGDEVVLGKQIGRPGHIAGSAPFDENLSHFISHVALLRKQVLPNLHRIRLGEVEPV